MRCAPRHILVPVDADIAADREMSDSLVDAAIDMSGALDATLTLLHVALPAPGDQPPAASNGDSLGDAYSAMIAVVASRNQAASERMAELKQRVVARGRTCETKIVTSTDSVPEAIVASAAEAGADLLMMTSHGRRGLKKVVMGSVAERTTHLSTVPVLLLPPLR